VLEDYEVALVVEEKAALGVAEMVVAEERDSAAQVVAGLDMVVGLG